MNRNEEGTESGKEEEQRMNLLYKEAEDEIHALLYYYFCLNIYITHPQFIYVVLEIYYTENILPFTLNIMLTDSFF